MPRDPVVFTLRALRRTSHLSSLASARGARFFDRLAGRMSEMIGTRSGHTQGSVGVLEYLHANFPQIAPLHPALPALGQRPAVTVFGFLDPRGFYGGIATLLIVAASLANELGYDLRVVQTAHSTKHSRVLDFLRLNGIEISPERFSELDLSHRNPHSFGYLPLHPEDVVVVSAWWDASIAARLPLKKKFVYLIQDHEPIFYSNGDLKLLAEATYHSQSFWPLCNTNILYKFFANHGYDYIRENALCFEPAVKARVERTGAGEGRRLFLYGRTSVSRNAFFTALQAIDRAFLDERMGPGPWEVFCAGETGIPDIRLQSGLTMKALGKMDLADYYRFASSIDVTVSPMLAPHPNYPTLELASLGSMVISTVYETKQDLSCYSRNILLALPTVEDMSDKILAAAATDESTRMANMRDSSIGDDWSRSLSDPIRELADRIGR